MHSCRIHLLALALLVVAALAGVAVASVAQWGLDLTAWIALAALALSALLVWGGRRLREAWQEARWDAGQRLR